MEDGQEQSLSGSHTTGTNWRPLYGYRYWEINDRGDVRKTYYSKKYVDPNGYTYLHISQDGKQRKIALHRAVWEAFESEIPPGLMINHKNGSKTDNRLENLEVVTNRENISHYKNKLLTYKGEKVNTSKLTEDDVRAIRARKKLGVSSRQLAKEYGVYPSTIARVASGRNWKHVK